MFKDYYQVREWLEGFIPQVYGKKELGLARIENLLKLLGNPQDKFKSIHVTGTSGKGSTAFYAAKLLQHETRNTKHEAKIGLHISPHLVDIRERMQIFSSPRHPGGSVATDRISKLDSIASLQNDNVFMPMGRFLRLFSEIRPVVERIEGEKPELTPSYFEILVAAAFKYFAQERIDWAVVEVGLGGRLDATNVLLPDVSVITNVGLDHTDILGKTVEKIAYEKAGIIKKGVPVVTGASGRAFQVIADVARKRQAPMMTVDTQNGQGTNKFLALAAVRAAGVKVGGKTVETAFRAKFAGRLEEIESGVILDGAHNPDKIRFLIEFVRKFEIILVIAFKKGKEWKKMVDLLLKEFPISNFQFSIKKVIATKFYATTDMGRFAAVEPEEIADYAKSKWKVKVENFENAQEAVFEALNVTRNTKHVTSVVLVTGSLYLVGEVRTMWKLPRF